MNNLIEIDSLKKENKKLERDLYIALNKIDKAIEYIKEHNIIGVNKEYLPSGIERCCSAELLEILGDKECPKGYKSYKDYKKKEEAFVNHFCKGDKENE